LNKGKESEVGALREEGPKGDQLGAFTIIRILVI